MARVFICSTCGQTGHFAKSCPEDPARSLRGRDFGRWHVLDEPAVRDTKLSRWLWRCRCSCPAATVRLVPEDVLRRDESTSCGCGPKGKPVGAPVHCANCGGAGHHAVTCPQPPRVSTETKLCAVCGPQRGPRPLSDFSPQNSRCRECSATYNRERNARLHAAQIERPCVVCETPTASYRAGRAICPDCDNERQIEYRAAKKAGGHDVDRRSHLKSEYDIAPERYDEMFAAQSGCCAICRTDGPNRHKRFAHFHVDHNHETRTVRGLLCDACNMGLGNAQDSLTVLRALADYLESPPLDIYPDRPHGAAPERPIQYKERQRLRAAHPTLGQALQQPCPICRARPATDIDHDHQTDRIRGVLCNGCNTTLGHFKDDPALLRRAASYIERHKMAEAAGGKNHPTASGTDTDPERPVITSA